MAKWRQKLIELFPAHRADWEDEVGVYSAFHVLLDDIMLPAYQAGNTGDIALAFEFAEWCVGENELWNAAGVAFYEHLPDHTQTRADLPNRISRDVYPKIRSLLEAKLTPKELRDLDRAMKFTPRGE